jgi:hypothetical protein
MLLLRNFLVGAALLSLSACGFEPMYGAREKSSVFALQSIAVKDATFSRESGMLKAKIEDVFYRDAPAAFSSEKAFEMTVSLLVERKATIIDKDGEVQRYRIKVNSPYRVINRSDDSEITSGTINRTVSYSTSDDNYAEYVSSEDVVIKAVSEIAEEYALRMGARFSAYQQMSQP